MVKNQFCKPARTSLFSKFLLRYFWIRQYPYKSHIFRVIDILAKLEISLRPCTGVLYATPFHSLSISLSSLSLFSLSLISPSLSLSLLLPFSLWWSRKVLLLITIFMLLLVNNDVQKIRTRVTNTISSYRLTNMFFYYLFVFIF